MRLNIKKMNPNAILPTQGHLGDAGFDLYACDIPKGKIEIAPHDAFMVGTGVAIAIPKGYAGLILPRSGVASKRGLRPANTPGCIDHGYTGEIKVCLRNDTEDWQTIENGERLAQLVVVPFLPLEFNEVDELEETERGDGGFGSTGIN